MTRERIERLPEDDWRKHDTRFNQPQLSRNLGLVARLAAIAERYDTTPGAIAVAWTLRNPTVDGAIVGFRRPDQVDPIDGGEPAKEPSEVVSGAGVVITMLPTANVILDLVAPLLGDWPEGTIWLMVSSPSSAG